MNAYQEWYRELREDGLSRWEARMELVRNVPDDKQREANRAAEDDDPPWWRILSTRAYWSGRCLP